MRLPKFQFREGPPLPGHQLARLEDSGRIAAATALRDTWNEANRQLSALHVSLPGLKKHPAAEALSLALTVSRDAWEQPDQTPERLAEQRAAIEAKLPALRSLYPKPAVVFEEDLQRYGPKPQRPPLSPAPAHAPPQDDPPSYSEWQRVRPLLIEWALSPEGREAIRQAEAEQER